MGDEKRDTFDPEKLRRIIDRTIDNLAMHHIAMLQQDDGLVGEDVPELWTDIIWDKLRAAIPCHCEKGKHCRDNDDRLDMMMLVLIDQGLVDRRSQGIRRAMEMEGEMKGAFFPEPDDDRVWPACEDIGPGEPLVSLDDLVSGAGAAMCTECGHEHDRHVVTEVGLMCDECGSFCS